MLNLKNKNKNKGFTKHFIPNSKKKVDLPSTTFSFLKTKSSAGFTLVEMITAVAIFSMVMVIAMGALLAVLNANKQNQAIQTAVNNLSLALEMMSREIRVGNVYHCGDIGEYESTRDCSDGDDFFTFMSYEGDQVVFKHVLDDGEGRVQRSDDGGGDFLYLTTKVVVIEKLAFYAVGTDISDNVQPRVLVSISGYVDLGSIGDRGKSYFNLQTTVSQRIIDF